MPLIILAIFSFTAGFIGLPAWLGTNHFEEFLEPALHYTYTGSLHAAAHSHSLEIGLAVMVIALAIGSIYLAYHVLIRKPEVSKHIVARYPGVHRLLTNKFYVDELYDAVNEYLDNPDLDAEGRVLIKENEAGPFPGKAGKTIGCHLLRLVGING